MEEDSMGKGEVPAGLRLGRRRLPPLSVPGELFELYQPLIGSEAVMAWLNLRWLIHTGDDMSDIESVLRYRFGMTYTTISSSLEKLVEFELLELDQDGGYIVHEPLSADAFFPRFGGGSPKVEQPALPIMENARSSSDAAHIPALDSEPVVAAEPDEPPVVQPSLPEMPEAPVESGHGAAGDSDAKDLKAVVDIYHKRIGMLGPTQFEKLRFWVEEQGMEAEVVALAIEETVTSAKTPRINYLEGILKNWYNSGIRTLTDLMQDEYASRVLHPRSQRGDKSGSNEGAPNATAYQAVSPDLVDRWKELYPDEYE